MTVTARTAAPTRAPIDRTRRLVGVAGALYLVTFLSSIPAFFLKSPALTDPRWVLGTGPATGVVWGNLLDVVNALACIGTAVALFPVVRRVHEGVALGFVASRTLEAAVVMIGVVGLLSVVTLRGDAAGAVGAEADSWVHTAAALVAVHDGANALGPGLVPAVNALLLGSLLYRARLVPRVIPLLGLVGAPLLLSTAVATMFGATTQFSAVSGVAVVPIFFWELSLGVWMLVKGFRPSPR